MAEYSNRDRSKLFKSGLVDTPDIKDASVTLAKLGSDVVSDYALKSYVDTSVSNLIDSAPGVLDTLNELAAAINDDANFNADKMIEIFKGKDNDFSKAVCLNAAAGLIVSEKFTNFLDAYNFSREFILSGKPYSHLEKIQNV